MEYLKSLQQLGLNQREQDVYFSLLQLGKATANQVAYKAKTKRPTTYDILDGFKRNNIAFETKENKKRFFIANPPEKLLELIESQKRDLEYDLPVLKSIYNVSSERPKIAYFDGLAGIKQLYEDTLTLGRGEEILAYITSETPAAMPEFTKDYVKRRAQKGIKLRGIYQDSPAIRVFIKKDKSQLRTSKIVDPKKFNIKNEINIYANKIIINTYLPEPFGILIESKEVADTQRIIFEMAWQSLKTTRHHSPHSHCMRAK
ncbi:MAG: helix-turn-helix domain-containing protein [Patescibacteria group bacterium]|jgi:sugar-specific transcriptional regulator TrmB